MYRSSPSCQYGIPGNTAIVMEFNACNGNFGSALNTSFKYVCNEQKTGVNQVNWIGSSECKGEPVSTFNATDGFRAFDCTLPPCNDNDNALMEFEIYTNCSTPMANYVNLLTNVCVAFEGGTRSAQFTCNSTSYTYTEYYASGDCLSPLTETQVYVNGCNQNETRQEILKCTKPTNVYMKHNEDD